MMRGLRRWTSAALVASMLAALVVLGLGSLGRGGASVPWARLDLAMPGGLATGRQLAMLADTPATCHALLDDAGVAYATLPRRRDGPSCGYADAVRFTRGGARAAGYRPAPPALSCAVAAALAMWEWTVVQPAALRYLHQPVTAIEHLGSYNCRRIGDGPNWSEHASADAIDVSGVRLADGTRVTVLRDWPGADAKAGFLRAIRDGACGLFATTLSPAYNAAHRDHLHLDQARRGAIGGRACR